MDPFKVNINKFEGEIDMIFIKKKKVIKILKELPF